MLFCLQDKFNVCHVFPYLAGHCVDDPNQTVYVLAGIHDLMSPNNTDVYEVSEVIPVILLFSK